MIGPYLRTRLLTANQVAYYSRAHHEDLLSLDPVPADITG